MVRSGLNRDFKSRSIMGTFSGSVHKGEKSTRVSPTAPFAVASMGNRGHHSVQNLRGCIWSRAGVLVALGY